MKLTNINRQVEENNRLIKLDKLLIDGKYKQVIREAGVAIKKFPRQPFFYTILSIAHSQLGESKEAFNILKNSEKQFPGDYEVLFQLAKVCEDLSRFDEAEKYYYKSFDCTPPEYKDARSDCLNDIGALKCRLGNDEEAIDLWERALEIDPSNEKASANINYISTDTDSIDADFLINEFKVFGEIQKKKYFTGKGIEKFKSKKDRKQFNVCVESAWLREVMPNLHYYDEFSEKELINWYNELEIDFSQRSESSNSSVPIMEDEFSEVIKKKFSFLPEDGLPVALAAGQAMDFVGLNPDVIGKIVLGVEIITEKQKELLIWSYELGKLIMEADAKTKKKQLQFLDSFMGKLKEQLNENDAIVVMRRIMEQTAKL
ncbi:MAG: tetratricopeptide repeat protein [Bacteroidetes bacterium]|nr:tetratricopeptide repeat protein [Bacteroidota bacterium]